MYEKLSDHLSMLISLIRYANALGKLSNGLRSEIFEMEQAIKAMINRRWTHIMLHHSLTKDGAIVSWQAIRRYHKETMGWNDIGYHFGIELINDQYEILIGRPLDQEGSHCIHMNEKAIGICFVGNFDEALPSKDQWGKGLDLVRGLVKLLDIPEAYIVGHRDYAPKSCPGKFFSLVKFKEDLKGGN